MCANYPLGGKRVFPLRLTLAGWGTLRYTAHMKTNRPQASKRQRAIDAIGQAEVDRARSNAAGPHRLKTTYTRKTKHKGQGWA